MMSFKGPVTDERNSLSLKFPPVTSAITPKVFEGRLVVTLMTPASLFLPNNSPWGP